MEMADPQQLTTGSRSVSASKRHTVQFGEMLEDLKEHLPVEDVKKRDRSESAAAVADGQPPNKRQRHLFGPIRNRLSAVSTPAFDNAQSGRKSSASTMIRDFGHASKGFLGKLAPPHPTGLPPSQPVRRITSTLAPRLTSGEEHYHIRVAFIGDGRCGKTALIQRLATGAVLSNQQTLTSTTTSTSASNAYSMQVTAPVKLDNYQAVLEFWDISSCLNPNQINPLRLSFFDAVVICFDVTDEANLKSVVEKWQHETNVFCPGIPIILLGLKSDLRVPYPTLKLRFLEEDEPTAATIGQAELTAEVINGVGYFECSAKTGEGTADFLESMIRVSVKDIKARGNISKKTRKASSFFRKK